MTSAGKRQLERFVDAIAVDGEFARAAGLAGMRSLREAIKHIDAEMLARLAVKRGEVLASLELKRWEALEAVADRLIADLHAIGLDPKTPASVRVQALRHLMEDAKELGVTAHIAAEAREEKREERQDRGLDLSRIRSVEELDAVDAQLARVQARRSAEDAQTAESPGISAFG